MAICSHTLVRNGMPFIGLVIRQVIPYVNRCLITISRQSTDGTIHAVKKLQQQFPQTVFIEWEDVSSPAELTHERQKQVANTFEDWILFLDDDDYWMHDELSFIKRLCLDADVDAYAFNPYQIIDKEYYDDSWRNKWFTKLFRNKPGLHYEKPWPRDLIYLEKKELYWRTNKRVVKSPYRYIHLPLLKGYSFREQNGFEKYKYSIGKKALLPAVISEELEKIL